MLQQLEWLEILKNAAGSAQTVWHEISATHAVPGKNRIVPLCHSALAGFPDKSRQAGLFYIRSHNIWLLLCVDDQYRDIASEALEIMAKSVLKTLGSSSIGKLSGAYVKLAASGSSQGIADQVIGEALSAGTEYVMHLTEIPGAQFCFIVPCDLVGACKSDHLTFPCADDSSSSSLIYPGKFVITEGPVETCRISSSIAVVFSSENAHFSGIGIFSTPEKKPLSSNLFDSVEPGLWLACHQFRERVKQEKPIRVSVFGGANMLSHPTEKFCSGFKNWQNFDKIISNLRVESGLREIGGNLSRRLLLDPEQNRVVLSEGEMEKVYDL